MDGMTKPQVEFPGGEPPADLQINDLVVGDGVGGQPRRTVDPLRRVEFYSGEEFSTPLQTWRVDRVPLRAHPGLAGTASPACAWATAAADRPAGAGVRTAGVGIACPARRLFVIDLLACADVVAVLEARDGGHPARQPTLKRVLTISATSSCRTAW